MHDTLGKEKAGLVAVLKTQIPARLGTEVTMSRKIRKSLPRNFISNLSSLLNMVSHCRTLQAPKPLLSPNDIAKIMGLTGEAVEQWIRNRRLPAVKLANGYWKVHVADFEAFLKARNDFGRRRVMIYCRRNASISVFAEAIENLGHELITSNGFADALLKAADYFPALLIIDCAAKKIEPLKFAHNIRMMKSMHGVQILLVGEAELSDADADFAVTLEAQGDLKGPMAVQVLQQEIERVLKR